MHNARHAQLYQEALEVHIDFLNSENTHLKSLLSSFWTGNLLDNTTLDHMVLAKAGRMRLEEKAKVCALFRT